MVEDWNVQKVFLFLIFGSIKLVQIKAILEDVCLMFIM
jgi:hypothetical protein